MFQFLKIGAFLLPGIGSATVVGGGYVIWNQEQISKTTTLLSDPKTLGDTQSQVFSPEVQAQLQKSQEDQQKLSNLEKDLEELDVSVSLSKQVSANINTQLSNISLNLEKLKATVEAHDKKITQLQEQQATNTKAVDSAKNEHDVEKSKVEDLTRYVHDADQKVNESQKNFEPKEALKNTALLSLNKNTLDLAEVASAIKKIQASIGQIELQQQNNVSSKTTLDTKISTNASQKTQKEQEITAEINNHIKTLENTVQTAKDEASKCETRIEAIPTEIANLQKQITKPPQIDTDNAQIQQQINIKTSELQQKKTEKSEFEQQQVKPTADKAILQEQLKNLLNKSSNSISDTTLKGKINAAADFLTNNVAEKEKLTLSSNNLALEKSSLESQHASTKAKEALLISEQTQLNSQKSTILSSTTSTQGDYDSAKSLLDEEKQKQLQASQKLNQGNKEWNIKKLAWEKLQEDGVKIQEAIDNETSRKKESEDKKTKLQEDFDAKTKEQTDESKKLKKYEEDTRAAIDNIKNLKEQKF